MQYSYKSIIHKLIDWERVKSRLSKYTHIEAAFPLPTLQDTKFTEKAPYYCHPLAYILGVWNSENIIGAFDSLLNHAETIPGWQGRINVTQEFSSFHSLRWELNMAKLLSDLPIDGIRWRPYGPDLEVDIDGQNLYIECYYYQKFYGKLLFLKDLLSRIDPRLHADDAWALRASFPTDLQAFGELLEFVLPKLTLGQIGQWEGQNDPYIYMELPQGINNVHIYFNNEHIPIRHHKVLHVGAGDTDLAMEKAIEEVLKHKTDSNNLRRFRPNIVAVDMAMSKNFLLGRDRAVDLKTPPPIVTLPDTIDGVVFHVSNSDNPYAFDTVFDQGSLAETLWRKLTRQPIVT